MTIVAIGFGQGRLRSDRVLSAARRRPLIAGIATAFVSALVLALLDVGGLQRTWQAAHWTLSAVLAAMLVVDSVAGTSGRVRSVRVAAAVAIGIWLLAQVITYLAVIAEPLLVFADAAFLLALVPGIFAINRAVSSRLRPTEVMPTRVDAVTVFFAIATFVVWGLGETALRISGLAGLLVVAYPIVFFATAGGALVTSLVVRARPPSYILLAGLITLGLGWVLRTPDTLEPLGGNATATACLFSAGILMVGIGGATWTDRASDRRRYREIARRLRHVVPLAAVLAAIAPMLLEHREEIEPMLEAGVAVVVVLALVRQSLLVINHDRLAELERAARDREREEEASAAQRRDVALDRATIANRLLGVDGAMDAGEACKAVCRAIAASVKLTAAGILVANGRGPASLASIGDVPAPLADGYAPLADLMHVESWTVACLGGSRDRVLVLPLSDVGDEEVILWAQPSDALDDGWLTARDAMWHEVGTLAGSILSPGLRERRERLRSRERIDRVMSECAFEPVFQPIVALEDGHVVGYEALTRFADGTRPDIRFAEAAAAGAGAALEAACMRAQFRAAEALPASAWLSVNVSPDTVLAVTPMVSALEGVRREVVLEITEHAAVDDYERLRAGIGLLGGHVRVSVDDAGSGYASLRHVLELHPAFVKLDMSIVRSIDADPARAGIVAGLVHFAAETGCALVAEGIETPAEHRRLIELGVRLGQGYLFGRPAPAAEQHGPS